MLPYDQVAQQALFSLEMLSNFNHLKIGVPSIGYQARQSSFRNFGQASPQERRKRLKIRGLSLSTSVIRFHTTDAFAFNMLCSSSRCWSPFVVELQDLQIPACPRP